MIITSSLIYYFLSQKYHIHIAPCETDNIPVTTLRSLHSISLVSNQQIPPGFYISEDIAILKKVTTEKCVFLLLGEPCSLDLPAKCSVAFIQTNESIDEIIYETSEISRKLQEWDLELKDATIDKTNLTYLLQVAQKIFPYPLGIVDRNYVVPAFTTDSLNNDILNNFVYISPKKLKTQFSVISELLLDPAFVDSLKREGAFLYFKDQEDTLLCMNIFENNQYLARILCTIRDDYSPGILYLFCHMCEYIKRVFLNYTDDILVKRQNDIIHTLLYDLIFDTENKKNKNVSDLLSDYGWNKSHRYTVIILRFSDIEEFNHIYYYVCNQLETQWPDSYAVKTEKEIIWIVNNDLNRHLTKTQTIHQALSYIMRDLICKSGVSDEANDIEKINILYEHAVFALESGTTTKQHFWYFNFNDYIFDYILHKTKTLIQNENLYHDGIYQLMEYDNKKSGNLTNVLCSFISNNFNASAASDKLFMHRSTFNRQMQKIEKITNVNWHNCDDINDVLHALITMKFFQKL